jgi:hypothetical protein
MLKLIAHLLNRSRLARVLAEIDAPRVQAIKEARLSAFDYIANPMYAASTGCWEGFDR